MPARVKRCHAREGERAATSSSGPSTGASRSEAWPLATTLDPDSHLEWLMVEEAVPGFDCDSLVPRYIDPRFLSAQQRASAAVACTDRHQVRAGLDLDFRWSSPVPSPLLSVDTNNGPSEEPQKPAIEPVRLRYSYDCGSHAPTLATRLDKRTLAADSTGDLPPARDRPVSA